MKIVSEFHENEISRNFKSTGAIFRVTQINCLIFIQFFSERFDILGRSINIEYSDKIWYSVDIPYSFSENFGLDPLLSTKVPRSPPVPRYFEPPVDGRSRLYRNEILQVYIGLKALAETYTKHSSAQLCKLSFLLKFI